MWENTAHVQKAHTLFIGRVLYFPYRDVVLNKKNDSRLTL